MHANNHHEDSLSFSRGKARCYGNEKQHKRSDSFLCELYVFLEALCRILIKIF